ncbi:MAG: cytochrome P450 [Candidatus Acidiferrales bacterium]
MPGHAEKIPPGPSVAFRPSDDLRMWINDNFRLYGDIYRASIFGTNVYVINETNYVQRVLRTNWANYKKGQAIKRIALLLGNGLMVSEGDFWKSQRQMVQTAFQRDVIAGLYDVMLTANLNLLAKWESYSHRDESVNVTSDVSSTVLEITLRAVFSVDYPYVAQFFNILHDDPARNLGFAQAFSDLRQVVRDLIERRRSSATETPDILGALMSARDQTGQPMPDDQLIKEITTIVVAGHETTASTLNLLWYLVSQNPEVERLLTAEVGNITADKFPGIDELPNFTYTRMVIDEALRLYPPGWLITRRARKDDRLGDYHVPAGTEIYISPYIIQRHPDLWAEPDSFQPERFNLTDVREKRAAAMLPFSIGPRNCIGEFFARTEMQIHVMTIARRIRLRFAEERPPEFEAEVNLRSKHDFVMSPEIKF